MLIAEKKLETIKHHVKQVCFYRRCTLVQSAVLRLRVICLFVCNVSGSGSHRLEILEN